MKRILMFGAILVSVLGTEFAHAERANGVRTQAQLLSQELAFQLGQFVTQTEREVQISDNVGNVALSRALRDVEFRVNSLVLFVNQRVVDPIRYGDDLRVAARNLQYLQPDFQAATQRILRLGTLPFDMQMTANQARNAHVQLKRLLGVTP